MNKRIKNQQNQCYPIRRKLSGDLNGLLTDEQQQFLYKLIGFSCQVNKQVNVTSLISDFADLQNLPGSELNEACQFLDNLMDTYPLLSSIIIRPGRHFMHAFVKHRWHCTFLLAVPKRTHKQNDIGNQQ